NLPRPLVAFWNTFVRSEAERIPVPGMATLYERFIAEHAGDMDGAGPPADADPTADVDLDPTDGEGDESAAEVPVISVSTGAWNTAPHLMRFIRRHGFPPGPLLLTDWGPTNSGWFRSGPEHKRAQLRRITRELPHIRWVLVGDTGQKDPVLYRDFAED